MADAVYVSIGNSDDKLTQREWHDFVFAVDAVMHSGRVHGQWYSRADAQWQNACWCVEFSGDVLIEYVKEHLRELAARFQQDSIAWADAKTIFLEPAEVPDVS